MHYFKDNTNSDQPAKAVKHTHHLKSKKKPHSYAFKHTELLMKIKLYSALGVCISYVLVRESHGIRFDAPISEDCSSLIHKRRQQENSLT